MVNDLPPEQTDYPSPAPELRVTDIQALKVLFSDQRLEIIEHLIDQPRSVQEVARLLEKPVHRLYYHFHKLEKYAFIRLVRTVQLPGAIEEKFYHITAYRMVIDRGLLSFHQETPYEQLIQNVLDETRSWITKDLDAGRFKDVNGDSGLDTALIHRKIAQIPQDDLPQFQKRLMALLDEFQDGDPPEPNNLPFALTLVLHPTESAPPPNNP